MLGRRAAEDGKGALYREHNSHEDDSLTLSEGRLSHGLG